MRAIPLWIAVPVTVAVSLPFGLWLGAWSLPLWLAFVVWAEYFTLGATPAALKTIVPAFISGVVGATVALIVALLAGSLLGDVGLVVPGDLAWFIGLPVAFIPVIYSMRFLPFVEGPGGLPFFNGISMGLATFFVGLYTTYGGLQVAEHSLMLPLVTSIPAILGGLVGAALGWFNVVIMTPFRRPVGSTEEASAEASS